MTEPADATPFTVQVSGPTTFHVVDLARQMERLGCLGRFCTALPASMTAGVPKSKTCRQELLLGPAYAARFVRAGRIQDALAGLTRVAFERWLAGKVTDCDVFHCLSGVCLRAHRVARERFGALTVCDRGSSHIRYQDALLHEEYARWGVPYRRIEPHALEKEETEYAECDLITVPSSFALRSFTGHGVPEGKIARLPYGVDLRQFQPIAKEDRVFRVVYVGQLSLRKGIQYLLSAVHNLPLRNFETMLVGTVLDEARPFLHKYGGTFNYVGQKPRSELHRYYSQGSVFVIASVEEGLATVQAQAMACGLPVIATVNTGAEDLFTDGVEGFIVPIRDPRAIREKLLYLYENPSIRDRMGEAALHRVGRLGGWDSYGESAVSAYTRALQSQRGVA